jgi:hypothetical protein
MLRTSFARSWNVRTPLLTRYLEAKYVELFFKEGVLRIPSFKKFRENPDEQRGDPAEGAAYQEITAPNARHTIVGLNGQEAYVLSCSTVEGALTAASFGTHA